MRRVENPGASGGKTLSDQGCFKQLFELSPDPTWIIDGNRFLECNEAAIKTLGYACREELLNVHPSKLSPPRQPDGEDSYGKAERMTAIAKDKGLHRFEWVHTRANGTDFVAEVTLSAIHVLDRQVIYCVWRDITECKWAQEALREATSGWQTTFDNTLEAICLLSSDHKILQANASMASLTGMSVESMCGKHCWEVVHGTAAPLSQCPLRRARTSLSREQMELQVGARWWNVTVDPVVGDAKEFRGAVHTIRDITVRKQTQEALSHSKQQYDNLVSKIPFGTYILNSKQDGSFALDYVSPRAAELFSASEQSLLADAKVVFQTIHPDDRDAFIALNQEGIEQLRPFEWSGRVQSEGRVKFFHIGSTPDPQANGDVLWLGIVEDITERKQMELHARELAFYDPLTQLPNRRLLADRLNQSLAESKRSKRYGALIFLDLDNFKALNDKHGHAVGDLLLVQAAQRMKNCVREVDTVARHGGDEFVVMMGDLSEDKTASTALAGNAAEKIRAALAEPYLLAVKHGAPLDASVEHCCTASIGLVVFIDQEGTQDGFLRLADTAMYLAKNAGGNMSRLSEADVQP